MGRRLLGFVRFAVNWLVSGDAGRAHHTIDIVRAHRPGFHPRLDELARLLLRARGGLTTKPGRPGPADQTVDSDVMHERFQRPAAVALGILDLRADLTKRLAFPGHFARCEVPVG